MAVKCPMMEGEKMNTTCCNRCGKSISGTTTCFIVVNAYPIHGFAHDTEHILCPKCKDSFTKYITKAYNEFFTYSNKDKKETNR